jgi:hypothetical protein
METNDRTPSLGRRCDEILALIDAVLDVCAASAQPQGAWCPRDLVDVGRARRTAA